MKILIAAATWMEIKFLADELNFVDKKNQNLFEYRFNGNEIFILITGIGTTYTTFRLTHTLLKNNFHMVINSGIAGSLNPGLKIGEVVHVITEEFADVGIEEKEGFLTLFESGFIDFNEFPFEDGRLKASYGQDLLPLKKVHGATANKSHGKDTTIHEIRRKFQADVESMEGAAVFFVCLNMGVPCHQIRAISNYVEPRDPSHWNIPLALFNLKTTLLKLLTNISVPVA